jgi:hypothetical protein
MKGSNWVLNAYVRDEIALYQRPYPMTGIAQLRRVMDAMRSGIRMSAFQDSRMHPGCPRRYPKRGD